MFHWFYGLRGEYLNTILYIQLINQLSEKKVINNGNTSKLDKEKVCTLFMFMSQLIFNSLC